MIEKSAAVLVTLILMPMVVLTGFLSHIMLTANATTAAVGLLLVTLCLILCVTSLNVTVFSRKFGARTQIIGKAYRKALASGKLKSAGKLWRYGLIQGFKWNLVGKLNIAAAICSVVGLTLLFAGLGLQ